MLCFPFFVWSLSPWSFLLYPFRVPEWKPPAYKSLVKNMVEQVPVSLRTLVHGRSPTLKQGNRVIRKEQWRGAVTYWPQHWLPIPLCCSRHCCRAGRWFGNEGVKGILGKRSGEVGGRWGLYLVFASHNPNIF